MPTLIDRLHTLFFKPETSLEEVKEFLKKFETVELEIQFPEADFTSPSTILAAKEELARNLMEIAFLLVKTIELSKNENWNDADLKTLLKSDREQVHQKIIAIAQQAFKFGETLTTSLNVKMFVIYFNAAWQYHGLATLHEKSPENLHKYLKQSFDFYEEADKFLDAIGVESYQRLKVDNFRKLGISLIELAESDLYRVLLDLRNELSQLDSLKENPDGKKTFPQSRALISKKMYDILIKLALQTERNANKAYDGDEPDFAKAKEGYTQSQSFLDEAIIIFQQNPISFRGISSPEDNLERVKEKLDDCREILRGASPEPKDDEEKTAAPASQSNYAAGSPALYTAQARTEAPQLEEKQSPRASL